MTKRATSGLPSSSCVAKKAMGESIVAAATWIVIVERCQF